MHVSFHNIQTLGQFFEPLYQWSLAVWLFKFSIYIQRTVVAYLLPPTARLICIWIRRVSGYYLIHSHILVCIWYNKILLVFCPSSHLSSRHVYRSLAISILIFYTDSHHISLTSHHKAHLYWIRQVSGCYLILICIWYDIHTAWSRKWKLISCVRSKILHNESAMPATYYVI